MLHRNAPSGPNTSPCTKAESESNAGLLSSSRGGIFEGADVLHVTAELVYVWIFHDNVIGEAAASASAFAGTNAPSSRRYEHI